MQSSVISKLILLFAGHALFDYPLQGPYLTEAKNHKLTEHWRRGLFAHAMMHCAMVYLITGSIGAGLAELVIHAATDYAKCDGRIDSTTDQGIHYACKIVWATWPFNW